MSSPEGPSYRTSHLGSAKALGYDAGFWSARSAKGIGWQLEQELLDVIFERHFVRAPRRALDFACGTGRVLAYLEDRVPEAIGVDVSPAMLAVARERCVRARLIERDVTVDDVPDLTGEVELVTVFRFFLNAEPPLRRAVLDWIHSVLVPEGHLVANFHLNPHSLRGRYLRLRAGRSVIPMLSPSDVERMLADAGFHLVAYYGYEFLPYRRDGERVVAPRLRERLERRLLIRARLAAVGASFVVVARPM
jgi:SAM-dependent methyltransferase